MVCRTCNFQNKTLYVSDITVIDDFTLNKKFHSQLSHHLSYFFLSLVTLKGVFDRIGLQQNDSYTFEIQFYRHSWQNSSKYL